MQISFRGIRPVRNFISLIFRFSIKFKGFFMQRSFEIITEKKTTLFYELISALGRS